MTPSVPSMPCHSSGDRPFPTLPELRGQNGRAAWNHEARATHDTDRRAPASPSKCWALHTERPSQPHPRPPQRLQAPGVERRGSKNSSAKSNRDRSFSSSRFNQRRHGLVVGGRPLGRRRPGAVAGDKRFDQRGQQPRPRARQARNARYRGEANMGIPPLETGASSNLYQNRTTGTGESSASDCSAAKFEDYWG